MRRYKWKEKPAANELKAFATFIEQVGGVLIPYHCPRWSVPTIFGPLEVWPQGNWIAARFTNDPLASTAFDNFPARDALNRFSWKWNCCVSVNGLLDFQTSFAAFQDRLTQIAIIKPEAQPAS